MSVRQSDNSTIAISLAIIIIRPAPVSLSKSKSKVVKGCQHLEIYYEANHVHRRCTKIGSRCGSRTGGQKAALSLRPQTPSKSSHPPPQRLAGIATNHRQLDGIQSQKMRGHGGGHALGHGECDYYRDKQ